MASPTSNRWATDPECTQLINFLIEKTKEAKSVVSINQLAREFKENSQSLLSINGLRDRIRSFRPRIHTMKHIDMDTKVRLLFGLSGVIDNDFLEKLKTQAEVIVDNHQRIIKYKKKGGGLKLSGTHRAMAARDKITKKNKKMMEFLAQKAMEADSPIPVKTFVREFKEATGATQIFECLRKRYKKLREKIHKSTDFDEKTKLRIIFVSGASVPNYFLELLRNDALVEVDESNRIVKYEGNDGSLFLAGDHSMHAKLKAGWVARKKRNQQTMSTDSDTEIKSDIDSGDNTDEEFETDSENENYPEDLDYAIPLRRRSTLEMTVDDESETDPSTERFHRNEESEKKQKRKSRSNNRNMNPETDDDEAQNTEEQVTTRSGRVSKKRVSNFNLLMDESKDNEALPSTISKKSSSATSISNNPDSTKKKRKADMTRASSSKRVKPVSDDFLRPDELDDYDPNYSFHRTEENPIEAQAGIREDETGGLSQSPPALKSSEKKRKADVEISDLPKTTKTSSDNYDPNQSTDDSSRVELKSFRGSIAHNVPQNSMDEDIQVLERPAPEVSGIIEAPIKIEGPGTPQQVEMPGKNPVEEDVKPKFTSQLKLLEMMKSLVGNLDISSLSSVKSKIRQKIWKLGKSEKGISDEEMAAAMELLFARIANHSVSNIPENVESFNLIQFLCYFKAAISSLNSDGLDSLLEKIKRKIREASSKDKSIPVETVASVLQTTLDFISF